LTNPGGEVRRQFCTTRRGVDYSGALFLVPPCRRWRRSSTESLVHLLPSAGAQRLQVKQPVRRWPRFAISDQRPLALVATSVLVIVGHFTLALEGAPPAVVARKSRPLGFCLIAYLPGARR